MQITPRRSELCSLSTQITPRRRTETPLVHGILSQKYHQTILTLFSHNFGPPETVWCPCECTMEPQSITVNSQGTNGLISAHPLPLVSSTAVSGVEWQYQVYISTLLLHGLLPSKSNSKNFYVRSILSHLLPITLLGWFEFQELLHFQERQ